MTTRLIIDTEDYSTDLIINGECNLNIGDKFNIIDEYGNDRGFIITKKKTLFHYITNNANSSIFDFNGTVTSIAIVLEATEVEKCIVKNNLQ